MSDLSVSYKAIYDEINELEETVNLHFNRLPVESYGLLIGVVSCWGIPNSYIRLLAIITFSILGAFRVFKPIVHLGKTL